MISSDNTHEALFDRLYEEYSRLVMRIVLGVTKDKHLAEDAFQMTFFSLAKNIGKITDDPEKTRNYIIRIARNSAIDIYRKSQKTRKFEITMPEESGSNEYDTGNRVRSITELSVGSFEEMLFREYDRVRLVESLKKLGEKHLVYIRDYYYDGLSMRQIAQKHGISEETAKKRVHRSLEKLKVLFLQRGV